MSQEENGGYQKNGEEEVLLVNEVEDEEVDEKNLEDRTSLFAASLQNYSVELFGTMMFVFLGTAAVENSLSLVIGVEHGLVITLLVAGFGSISGGHFNPCVTLGVLFAGSIEPLHALGYILSQLVGGLFGAGLCRGVLSYPVEVDNKSVIAYVAINGGAHMLAPGVTVGSAILVELLTTTVLVLTVLMTAVDPKTKSPIAPLAIGFAVATGILAGFNVSGGSMNPARSLGPAVVLSSDNPAVWRHHYVYWVGPILGSCIAGALYRFVFADKSKRFFAYQKFRRDSS